MSRVESIAELEELYRAPSERVRTKKRDHLDPGTCAVLAASPFVLLSTSDDTGRCDVSPRGGPPGFVRALDDRHVAVPDLNGNNLIDSLRNVVTNPHAGLLVIVPGEHETLRIDGRAHLSRDAAVLDLFTDEVRRPVIAVIIRTDAVFTHCAKAFRRSRLWEPESWESQNARLSLAARYRQLGLDVPFEEYVRQNAETIAADLAADRPDVPVPIGAGHSSPPETVRPVDAGYAALSGS